MVFPWWLMSATAISCSEQILAIEESGVEGTPELLCAPEHVNGKVGRQKTNAPVQESIYNCSPVQQAGLQSILGKPFPPKTCKIPNSSVGLEIHGSGLFGHENRRQQLSGRLPLKQLQVLWWCPPKIKGASNFVHQTLNHRIIYYPPLCKGLDTINNSIYHRNGLLS